MGVSGGSAAKCPLFYDAHALFRQITEDLLWISERLLLLSRACEAEIPPHLRIGRSAAAIPSTAAAPNIRVNNNNTNSSTTNSKTDLKPENKERESGESKGAISRESSDFQ